MFNDSEEHLIASYLTMTESVKENKTVRTMLAEEIKHSCCHER